MVLRYANSISNAVVGCSPTCEKVIYAESLFTTIIVYSSTLRSLMPDPNEIEKSQIWDLPSAYIIARSLIEAHDKFLYVASCEIPEDEAAFRILLWKYHDSVHRYRMLKEIGSHLPLLTEYEEEASGFLSEITSHKVFKILAENKQREIKKQNINSNTTVDYHFTKKERCDAFGLDLNFYNTVIMHLSQYVHLYPFALHELASFRAGSEEALSKMSRSLQYTLPFLIRITKEFRVVASPILTPDPSSADLFHIFNEWEYIYKNGLLK